VSTCGLGRHVDHRPAVGAALAAVGHGQGAAASVAAQAVGGERLVAEHLVADAGDHPGPEQRGGAGEGRSWAWTMRSRARCLRASAHVGSTMLRICSACRVTTVSSAHSPSERSPTSASQCSQITITASLSTWCAAPQRGQRRGRVMTTGSLTRPW